MLNKRPNFLIVGGAKCGTTSIYKYLRQHPQIFMSEHKEPLFMMSSVYKNLSLNDPRREISENHTVFSFKEYLDLFREVNNEIAIGEASTTYLYYHKVSIPNIKRYLGDTKILISLRNPVDRAYSAYTHLVRDGAENSSFEKFLKEEEKRKSENWDLLNLPISSGLYYDQVKAYLSKFDQVKICLLDDMKEEPVETIKDLFTFLEVDPVFEPDLTTTFNSSGIAKNVFLYSLMNQENLLKRLGRLLLRNFISPESKSKLISYIKDKNRKNMKPATREALKIQFREDIMKLQDLIDRDLTHWL